MARPRTFDDGKALDGAVACFWRNGFEGTSVRDLTAEMGIACPILYNAFGDKRSLFAQALERYAAAFMRERLARLERSLPPKAAIQAFFDELIARSMSDPERRGCLIVNSALEVAAHDSELCELIAGYLGELEQFFRRCIDRGQSEHLVPTTLAAGDTARLLLGSVLALRVMARVQPERSMPEAMVRPALRLLDFPPKPTMKGKA